MRAVTKTLLLCSIFALVSLVVVNADVVAQEMTMKEYKIQLQEWVDKESAANDERVKLEAEIESLKTQIAEVEGNNSDTWAAIYAALGVTEADVNAYRDELNVLGRDLNALGTLAPEDLWQRRKEIDALEAKIAEMKNSPIYTLSEMRDNVASLEGKVAQLRAKMPQGMYDEYTVIRGDYLWKIARKSDIYNDAYAWIRIYSYNSDQIKDPDLIYTEQIFKIHRENSPNEYLVGNGDNLSKIAGSIDVMGDPTKWRAIYDLNKNAIGDEPSLIYPHQVLKIPSN